MFVLIGMSYLPARVGDLATGLTDYSHEASQQRVSTTTTTTTNNKQHKLYGNKDSWDGHTVQTDNFSHLAVVSNYCNTIRDVMVDSNNNSHATGKNRGNGSLPAFQRRGNQGYGKATHK